MRPTAGDDERGFERLIARGLASTSSAGEDCPSADVLAAWVDRVLSPAEASGVQAHLAGCLRCQQVVAATAEAEPEPAVPERQPNSATGRSWVWHWRWAVPLATAAVVIVVVGNRTTMAPGEQDSVVSRPAPAGQVAQFSPRSTEAVPTEEPLAPSTESIPPAAPPLARSAIPSPPPATGFARQRSDEIAADEPVALPPPPSAPSMAGLPEGRFSQKAAAPSAGAPPAAQSPMAVLSESAAKPVDRESKPRTADGQERTFLADAVGRKNAVASSELAILSAPGSPVAWRFGDGGVIERTPDGKAWIRQESGVTSSLLAGWAVSSRICWIGGRDGVVLRTVNGLTWTRVAAPAPGSVVAVFAASAEAASVRMADGREFVTTDGGATWQPR